MMYSINTYSIYAPFYFLMEQDFYLNFLDSLDKIVGSVIPPMTLLGVVSFITIFIYYLPILYIALKLYKYLKSRADKEEQDKKDKQEEVN